MSWLSKALEENPVWGPVIVGSIASGGARHAGENMDYFKNNPDSTVGKVLRSDYGPTGLAALAAAGLAGKNRGRAAIIAGGSGYFTDRLLRNSLTPIGRVGGKQGAKWGQDEWGMPTGGDDFLDAYQQQTLPPGGIRNLSASDNLSPMEMAMLFGGLSYAGSMAEEDKDDDERRRENEQTKKYRPSDISKKIAVINARTDISPEQKRVLIREAQSGAGIMYPTIALKGLAGLPQYRHMKDGGYVGNYADGGLIEPKSDKYLREMAATKIMESGGEPTEYAIDRWLDTNVQTDGRSIVIGEGVGGIRSLDQEMMADDRIGISFKDDRGDTLYGTHSAHELKGFDIEIEDIRAAGGYIEGPGGPRTDSIPANLSDGEFVMTADAVDGAGGPGVMYDLMHQFEGRG